MKYMAGIKIADIAKKLGTSEEETKKKIVDGGHKVADDNTVDDSAVKDLGVDPKHLRLDRRQEMLKKAMERHKRHPKSREVKVGSENEPSTLKRFLNRNFSIVKRSSKILSVKLTRLEKLRKKSR